MRTVCRNPGPVRWAVLSLFVARRRLLAARPLPAVVRERFVRLRHPVDVVLALERRALLLLGV